MDINQLTLTSINRYYNILSHTGYLEDSQVNKLLLLVFITELFQDDFSWFMSDDDYSRLMGIIDCISKSTCIVPYTKSAIHIKPVKNYLEDIPSRVSETNIIRLTESDLIRLSDV